MENVELKQFRKVNHLDQSEVAEYLGVSRAQVSMIERGKSKLTNENLRKLIVNPYGWEISMLPKDPLSAVNSVVINGSNEIKNSTIDNRHYYSDSPDVLRAQIDLLDDRIQEKEERLKEKDAQIKEKDAQIKEKDAQIKEKDAQIKQLLDIIQGMKK